MNFLQRQNFVVVSTLDSKKRIHCSAKGIAGIEKEGKIYLIDVYLAQTFKNLQCDPTMSITAVDEALFTGYTLKGKASIVERDNIPAGIVKTWEEKVVKRVSRRVITNIRKDTKGRYHPEARLPHLQYMIIMEVDEIIDLTPAHLKQSLKEE